MMTARLIVAIVSTLLEEAALAVIVLWGLPRLGIEIHLAVLITVMVVWAIVSIFLYQMGSRALRRKPLYELLAMVGSRGKVVSPLSPAGLIKIKDELWVAESASGKIRTGEEVTVIGQDGLRLVVSKSGASDSETNE